MVELIDRIKDDALRAFVFRIYNNLVAFGTVAGPIVAVILVDYIAKNNIEAISELFVWEVWDKIFLIVVAQVLSAIVAGSFKAGRVEQDLRE